MNPLFPDSPQQASHKALNNTVLEHGHKRRIEPLKADDPAANLARRKLGTLYQSEPRAREEMQEAEAARPRSKHQQFMHQLNASGKPLAQIQREWHAYYMQLPDTEKHEVWQEFYEANERHPSSYARFVKQHAAKPVPELTLPNIPTAPPHDAQARAKRDVFLSEHVAPAGINLPTTPGTAASTADNNRRSLKGIKKHVLGNVRARSKAQTKAKQHLQSVFVGLAIGFASIAVVLFSFFNEYVIAPFIQPSGSASAAPIILEAGGVAPSSTPEVIIPKINAQLPVVYNVSSSQEHVIQDALNNGVVHYPSTAVPGQQGNVAVFGHSSNNIFNSGKYKFAFVLLHELEPGDIFYMTYNNKVYSYRVFKKQIVNPDETWVLGPVEGKPATAALITCDPPGTSLRRLVVWGEQISPNPMQNAAAPTDVSATDSTQALPSDGPTLWTRIWRNLTWWD